MIRRPFYMDKFRDLHSSEVVKVIVGVRRCGKSTLLKQLRNDLVEQGVSPEAIIYVDFELPSNAPLTDTSAFLSFVGERARQQSQSYLFVDEVQELEGWEKAINGLRAEFGLNIYVTGSNARMFAGEESTYLAGRYVSVPVFPLSLAEFCQFTSVEASDPRAVEGAYQLWLWEGSFPAVALAPNEALKQALLDGIYESVFTRDIILRGRIRNEAAFVRVASFVLENIGNLTSASAIERALKSGGHRVGAETVDSYLRLMQSAHLLYRCDRFDIRGKERLRTNGKYYVVDPGLRNRVIGFRQSNHGHVTENMVYLELVRRGYEVSVGTLPGCEIDFVAQREGALHYIQVSETVADPAVLQRELAPFAKLRDAHPRVLITKDRSDYGQEGVRHMNLFDFLLGEKLP